VSFSGRLRLQQGWFKRTTVYRPRFSFGSSRNRDHCVFEVLSYKRPDVTTLAFGLEHDRQSQHGLVRMDRHPNQSHLRRRKDNHPPGHPNINEPPPLHSSHNTQPTPSRRPSHCLNRREGSDYIQPSSNAHAPPYHRTSDGSREGSTSRLDRKHRRRQHHWTRESTRRPLGDSSDLYSDYLCGE
jgi:hypothetical protein